VAGNKLQMKWSMLKMTENTVFQDGTSQIKKPALNDIRLVYWFLIVDSKPKYFIFCPLSVTEVASATLSHRASVSLSHQ
jgi:hypothetical protein